MHSPVNLHSLHRFVHVVYSSEIHIVEKQGIPGKDGVLYPVHADLYQSS